MSRITPPDDWQPLVSEDDWKAHGGGVLVVHQRNPIDDEAAAKYHGRECRHVQHGVFRSGVGSGSDNTEWFRAPTAASAIRGGAVACEHCGGA
jgi:hypothetical protein